MSHERKIKSNGVELCIETFGDPEQPAILLIHGASASMLGWEDGFCARLSAGGRFVIRYDHRDTGRSTSYDPGAPPYGMRDLMEDAMGILDVLGIGRAHLVGRSMGGGIALLAALEHPERIASLTLMATSPGGPGLSPPSKAFLDHMQRTRQPDWSDRKAVIEHIVAMLRVFNGGAPNFEEASVRDLVTRDVERTVNIASSQINHFRIAFGEPIRDRIGGIRAPTLVIHGEKDPVFPLDHGQALAKAIPGADFLILPDTGHLVLAPNWTLVLPAILKRTAG